MLARISALSLTASLSMALASCASTPVRDSVSLTDMIDDLATHDVVFLGEEHDNSAGHDSQLAILRGLHEHRPQLVLSLEMFERDVQEPLDAYLAGDLDEEAFLEQSRPWGNYKRHYRPLIEYAKEHGLPVIAANVPRALATRVAKEGLEVAVGDPHAARSTTAPRDGYWIRFEQAMAEHMGADSSDAITRMYEAQCLKDDTMAESIAAALAVEPGETPPLVVHVCGKFHSDHGYGTVARLRARRPDLSMGIVSMDSRIEVGSPVADYVLVLPPEPARKGKETASEGGEEGKDAGGRPALGIMPDYESDDGVGVQSVREGGPADQAGFEVGDVIIEIGGLPVSDVQEYMTVLETVQIGETVEVLVMRGSEEKRMQIKIGRRGH